MTDTSTPDNPGTTDPGTIDPGTVDPDQVDPDTATDPEGDPVENPSG